MADNRYGTGWGVSADKTLDLECAIKFLQKYPDFTQFVLNKSSFEFDIQSLITEAKKLDLQATVEDIRKEFDANGNDSEVSDDVQCTQQHNQLMSPYVLRNRLDADSDDKETSTDEPANGSTESDVFQDITNQLKQRCNLRKNKNVSNLEHCVFCLNNGADKEVYESHNCKDGRGNVTCPVLQKFVCSRCHATGTNAHTAKYCPLKPIITPEDCLAMEERWQQKRRRRPAVAVNINDGTRNEYAVATKSRSRLRF